MPAADSDVAFGQELARAAEAYNGSSFVVHTTAANCYDRLHTQTSCMSTGLGTDGFDCTGLVLRAMSDVLGKADCDWATAIRHGPQMYLKADHMPREQVKREPIGAIVVYSQFQRLEGGDSKLVFPAAHVGIYVGKNQIVHARQDGTGGVVTERIFKLWGSKRFTAALVSNSLIRELC